MYKAKISIIIPVYNAENHIKNCINSLLDQSFSDFEVLIIDDGSTDNSLSICRKLSESKSNIFVFTKENGGAASARNMGIMNAKGSYISFIDSDDTVDKDFLLTLYNNAIQFNADIVMCDYVKHHKDKKILFSQPIRDGYYSKAQIKSELFPCLIMFDSLEFPPTISNCVCLFKRTLLTDNKILYPEVRLCEDSFFGSVALYNANSFFYIKGNYLYNYFYYETSVSHCSDIKKLDERWKSFLILNEKYYEFFNKENNIFINQIKYNMLYFALNQLSFINLQNFSFMDKLKQTRIVINNEMLRNAFKSFRYPKVNIKLKFLIFLIKHKMSFVYFVLRLHFN